MTYILFQFFLICYLVNLWLFLDEHLPVANSIYYSFGSWTKPNITIEERIKLNGERYTTLIQVPRNPRAVYWKYLYNSYCDNFFMVISMLLTIGFGVAILINK